MLKKTLYVPVGLEKEFTEFEDSLPLKFDGKKINTLAFLFLFYKRMHSKAGEIEINQIQKMLGALQ